MKLGRNVARTFLDYYKLVGYISAKPSSSLNPKAAQQFDQNGKGEPASDDSRYVYIEMVAECVINKLHGRRETIFMEFCSRITEYVS